MDFGAIPNDGLDDRAAILAAIRQWPGKDTTIYFPCGQWDASDDLAAKTAAGAQIARTTLECERRDCATIRLMDNAPGYGSAAAPKAFLMTGDIGGGNQAFQNNVLDCTIDTGSGNPGVRAVDFMAHNQGTMRNVTVRSGDGQGLAGVYLGRAWPGPALIENVRVEGFQRGYQMAQSQYSITFKDISASGQSVAALDVSGNAAFVDGFESTNTVPAIIGNAAGYVVLLNAQLGGGAPTRQALELPAGASYLLRDVQASGYADVMSGLGLAVGELASGYYGPSATTLRLPVPPVPPSFTSTDPADWANPLDYGAGNGVGGEGNDDVAGIQAAMNSGKPIVYYPKKVNGDRAWFAFKGGAISIPVTVRRVLMGGIEHQPADAPYQSPGACLYSIDQGTAADPPLEIEYFRRQGGHQVYPGHYFCHTSTRTVVFRRATSATWLGSGRGQLFALDNIASLEALDGYTAYLWQQNVESKLPPVGTTVVGAGSTVRVVGMKTELDFPAATVAPAGRYELLGAFLMPCVGNGAAPVASTGFRIEPGAAASLSFTQYCGGSTLLSKFFPIAVSQGAQDLTLADLMGTARRTAPLYGGMPPGWELFDAAVKWALERGNP